MPMPRKEGGQKLTQTIKISTLERLKKSGYWGTTFDDSLNNLMDGNKVKKPAIKQEGRK
jgi:hypothetical protein